jgi:DNA-binding NtrC family response regulator
MALWAAASACYRMSIIESGFGNGGLEGAGFMHSVLLIEDDESLREFLRVTLVGAGYAVAEAINGRQGVKAFRKSPTDLVVTDVYMPERDGLEVIEALRRSHPRVKVLAISGASGTMGYFSLAQSLGAVAVLQKPFGSSAFLKLVEQLLKSDDGN